MKYRLICEIDGFIWEVTRDIDDDEPFVCPECGSESVEIIRMEFEEV